MDIEFAKILRDGAIIIGLFAVALIMLYRNRRKL